MREAICRNRAGFFVSTENYSVLQHLGNLQPMYCSYQCLIIKFLWLLEEDIVYIIRSGVPTDDAGGSDATGALECGQDKTVFFLVTYASIIKLVKLIKCRSFLSWCL